MTTRPAGARDPELERWQAWTPAQAAAILAPVRAPWYVAGGWALDLFVGAQRRPHDDLEIGVPANRFPEFAQHLADYELFGVGQIDDVGLVWPLVDDGTLVGEFHQTWVREMATGLWRLDIFREPTKDGRWACRRDTSITLSYDELITLTDDGIPYARPEIVLMFKAKQVRDKDRADFDDVLPLLDSRARRWLADALELIHPDHEWIAYLG